MKEQTRLVSLREFIRKKAPDTFILLNTSDSGKVYFTVRTTPFLFWGNEDIARIYKGTKWTLVEWFPGAKPEDKERLGGILSAYRRYVEEHQAKTTLQFVERPFSLAEFLKRSLPKRWEVSDSYQDPPWRWPEDLWVNVFFVRRMFGSGRKVARVSVVDWNSDIEIQVFTESVEDPEYLSIKDLAKKYEAYVSGLRGVKPKIILTLVYSVSRDPTS